MIANHLWQSTVCVAAVWVNAGTEEEPGGCALLALAGSIGEVLNPFFVADQYRRSTGMAIGSRDHTAAIVHRDG
jgi:hypothetical protein